MAKARLPGIDAPAAQQRAYERAIRRMADAAWSHLRSSTLPVYDAAARERGDDLSSAIRRSLASLAVKPVVGVRSVMTLVLYEPSM